jgi:hypothetical protein
VHEAGVEVDGVERDGAPEIVAGEGAMMKPASTQTLSRNSYEAKASWMKKATL